MINIEESKNKANNNKNKIKTQKNVERNSHTKIIKNLELKTNKFL